MTTIRDQQLEGKIQERLERLGISNIPGQEDGTSYLEDVLYLILSDDGIDDVSEAQEKVAKERKVPLYLLQSKIGFVINVAKEDVLKSFYKAEDYNLKLVYHVITLIADDILMD